MFLVLFRLSKRCCAAVVPIRSHKRTYWASWLKSCMQITCFSCSLTVWARLTLKWVTFMEWFWALLARAVLGSYPCHIIVAYIKVKYSMLTELVGCFFVKNNLVFLSTWKALFLLDDPKSVYYTCCILQSFVNCRSSVWLDCLQQYSCICGMKCTWLIFYQNPNVFTKVKLIWVCVFCICWRICVECWSLFQFC